MTSSFFATSNANHRLRQPGIDATGDLTVTATTEPGGKHRGECSSTYAHTGQPISALGSCLWPASPPEGSQTGSAASRTLVIVLAQTREHAITFSSFQEHVLQALEADLAVCIGVQADYDVGNPFWRHAKYRFTYHEPLDFADGFNMAEQHVLGSKNETWRDFLRIRDQWLGGIMDPEFQHKGSAGILIFFRWYLLESLRQSSLLDRYDRFIVTRSDFVWTMPHPPMRQLPEGRVWIPDGEQCGGLTDRHVVLDQFNLVQYLDILPSLLTRKEEYLAAMASSEEWNLEKVVALHLRLHGVRVSHFPYMMYSVRSREGTTRWEHGVWSEDLGYFVKYPAEWQRAVASRVTFDECGQDIDCFCQGRLRDLGAL